jgi:hypothetical protein
MNRSRNGAKKKFTMGWATIALEKRLWSAIVMALEGTTVLTL